MLLLSRSLVAIALFSVAGCDSSDSDSAQSQIDADLQLELGQTGTSDGLTITFDAVTSDSRCPVNAVCIWEGEAGIRLVVNGTPDSLLVADPEYAPDAFVRRGDVVLRAVELAPYPGSREAQRGDTPVVSLTTELQPE